MSTDIWTSYAARTMVLSVIPFIIVQLPLVFKATSLSRAAVLISFIVSVSVFISYSLYQVPKDEFLRKENLTIFVSFDVRNK